jgi:hypothetical protein
MGIPTRLSHPLAQFGVEVAQTTRFSPLQPAQEIPPDVLHPRLYFPFGEKRALQTVLMVAYKFSPSRTRSIH